MKQLPEKFRARGFSFRLERRNGRAAIYRQQWKGKEDASIAYEVVRPVISTRQFLDGEWRRTSEPHEVYPSSETWGERVWTFTDLEDAVTKYDAVSSPHVLRRNRFDAPGGSGQRRIGGL